MIRQLKPGEAAPLELLLTADPERDMIESYLPHSLCCVLEDERVVIGVYVLRPLHAQAAEIVNIAVLEERQGQGYGKQLIAHAIQTAHSSGYQTLHIGTGNSSIMQLALYQKCGFRVTGIDHDFFTRNYTSPIYENGILCRDMIKLELQL